MPHGSGDESPLPAHMFLVLLVLNAGPTHGYGIKKAVAERSNGAVELDAGGMYRLIARLEERGWASLTSAPNADGDARRKYYELTPSGREALRVEAHRISRLAMEADVLALVREAAGG